MSDARLDLDIGVENQKDVDDGRYDSGCSTVSHEDCDEWHLCPEVMSMHHV
jgi:hypothetical protein